MDLLGPYGRRSGVIQLSRVSKVYRTGSLEVSALREVDLTVEDGEFVAIAGPSGSGKSTLMHILGCLDVPTSGRYLLAGEDVSRMTEDELAAIRNRRIGFVFQQFNLFPSLTAVENVEYALNVKRLAKRDARAEAERALDAVGLSDRKHFLPRDLSGGQKQRVAIARALAGRPAVLLADEPTANLDTQVGAQILELFRALAC